MPNVKYNAPANGEAPFSWLLKNTQYKVAGKKLIELYESKKEGEDVTPVEIMKIGQDVGLGLDGMSEVMKLVDNSGALRSSQIKRAYEAGQTAANTGLTESTKSEAYPAGLPADVAGAVIKEKAKPKQQDNLSYHIEKEQIGNQKVQDYRVWTDNKTGSVVKREPIGKPYANTEGVAEVRVSSYANMPTNTPGIYFERKTGKPFRIDDNGEKQYLKSGEVMAENLGYTEEKRDIQVQTGQRAASIITASNTFEKEMPEIIALRKRVQAKNLLPSGGLKDMEAVNQWLGTKTSDPDAAELKKKVKLHADLLQRTFGGSQGGQWAFEVAADILDPTLSDAAFERVYRSHDRTMKNMANEYKNFGKDKTTTPGGSPKSKFKIISVK